MRRFLYISPFFPPQGRVGALRPLKFARHLPRFGWAPVVLADLPPGERQVPELLEWVPDTTEVVRTYGPTAAPLRSAAVAEPTAQRPPRPSWWERNKPRYFHDRELIPLEKELPRLPGALRAARRVVRERPGLEAVMVNANPFGALLVGARLARETGLPLILDLRDPWSVCELQDARRTGFARWGVRRMERYAFARADVIISNTEAARDDYRVRYPDLGPDRFEVIRNHVDPELLWRDRTEAPGFDRFTLLFLGGFRRYLEGDTAFELLAELARRGLGDRVRLAVTGPMPEASWERARARGVDGMIERRPFVPLSRVGSTMEAADVLFVPHAPTRQRVMAKLYEYASSRRPVLAMADNPEVAELCAAHRMTWFPLGSVGPAAAWVAERVAEGRPADVERDAAALGSEAAGEKLAGLLDRITRAAPGAAGR